MQTAELALTTLVCVVMNDEEAQNTQPGTEIPTEGLNKDESLYTRHTHPLKPERVQAVLNAVKFGPDLTKEQRKEAEELISEFADCFALSVSEVTQVPDAVHHLNIPENTKFSTKVHQRPLMPPQCQFLNKNI